MTGVINALESMGKDGFAESIDEMSTMVQKIGTNHYISAKTVSFSLGAPYDSIPSLLALARKPPLDASASADPQNPQSPVWCLLVEHLQTFFGEKPTV